MSQLVYDLLNILRSYLNGLVVFTTFFNLSLNLAIRSSWSEPQSASSLVFADCIELLHLWLQRIKSIWFQYWPPGDVHLNAEFQRIARRDKKAFLSDQSKEIEENNRMGKTRDLFEKIRDTNGTSHAKMGSIKDRNGMNPTEAENIKNWQGYTEEPYKKDLQKKDNHDGVITHLEPDILQCEVKWALGNIMNKAWRWWNSSWAISNPERWCCESAALNMPANLENSAVATGLEKVSFHSNP